MILRFSRWFVTQTLHQYLLMRIYPKYRNGGTNGRGYLIVMLQNKPKNCKKIPSNHSDIYFNNMQLKRNNTQKHVGLYLDVKLNFSEHINEKIKKAVKGINLTKKLSVTLPRSSLLTIYKSFVRPHLDYGDVIYNQPNNNRLSEKIESIQYNAALAITGAIRGTSREKLYQELGLESLKDRKWLR